MGALKGAIEFIDRGGAISWILTILYFLVLAISFERILFFFLTRSSFNNIENVLKKAIKENSFSLFLENPLVIKYKNSQTVKIITKYIENKGLSCEAFNEALDREGFIVIREMEKNVWLLSQIGHIAPLLGLLGTVIGLIGSFQIMATLGAEADVSSFASGIWEAMITTANGLIVAIPAFFIHRILEKIVEKRSWEMTFMISILNQSYAIGGCSIHYNDNTTNDDNKKDEPHEMF